MAIINWNNIVIENVPLLEALVLFANLLKAATDRGVYHETFKHLPEEDAQKLKSSDAGVMLEGVSELSRRLGYFPNNLAPTLQEDGIHLYWRGTHTKDRQVEVVCHNDNTATVRFSTATGTPSGFLTDFCVLAARRALDEVKEVFDLIG